MRKMAIDYGDKRMGIAFSDPMCIIATGHSTYQCSGNLDKDAEYMANLAKERDSDTIVLGMPYNMDGTEGERAVKTRHFGELIKKFSNLPIVFHDERLTSVTAEEYLIEGRVRRDKRKELIDKVAAQVIMQSYLNKLEGDKNMTKTPVDIEEEIDDVETINLVDEEGNEIECYPIATFDHEDKWYIFLEPLADVEGFEEGDILIYELKEDEEGDLYIPIEDEALLNTLFEKFEAMMEENGCGCGCGCEDDCDCEKDGCGCEDDCGCDKDEASDESKHCDCGCKSKE